MSNEQPICPECGHESRFFYIDPRSDETFPRCWHQDEDGFCGHQCPAPAQVEPPRCVKCGHELGAQDDQFFCTTYVKAPGYPGYSNCGCKCEFPAPAVEAAPVRAQQIKQWVRGLVDAGIIFTQSVQVGKQTQLQPVSAEDVIHVAELASAPSEGQTAADGWEVDAAEKIDEYYDSLVGFNIRVMGAKEVAAIIREAHGSACAAKRGTTK